MKQTYHSSSVSLSIQGLMAGQLLTFVVCWAMRFARRPMAQDILSVAAASRSSEPETLPESVFATFEPKTTRSILVDCQLFWLAAVAAPHLMPLTRLPGSVW